MGEIEVGQIQPGPSRVSENTVSYNEAQREFILDKTFTVAKYFKATLWTWIAFIALLLSCVFHIVAFAAPNWVTVRDRYGNTRDVGLWMTCTSATGCYYHSVQELSDAVRASQAFAVFSLLAILASVLFTTVYIFFSTHQDPRFASGSWIFRVATALFLLITISVYGSRWADDKYEAINYKGSLGYCFAFEVVSFVCELCGSILMGGEIMNIMRNMDG